MKLRKNGFTLLLSALFFCASASAELRSRTVLMRSALWGAGIGTAAGLVSYPFAHSFSTITIGTLTGLILGLGAGIYYVNTRDDGQGEAAGGSAEYLIRARDPVLFAQCEGRPVLGSALRMNFPVIRF